MKELWTLLRRRWRHIGVGCGIILNALGLMLGKPELIATGSNCMVICGLSLAQRRGREEGDSKPPKSGST